MIDLSKNHIPEKIKSIHLIAACGTGMGALACLLKDKGYVVTGSDGNVYPPMSTFLEDKGIRVNSGFHEKHMDYGPDLVIVGNAVTKDNIEVLKMIDMGLCFSSMPQAVNHFIARGKKTILVCGTHGKTTTASILAWILYKAGLDPSFLIGGILKNFNSNYRLGQGEYIVIEGDEYDTAFFDKRPKFLSYDPYMAILTSVEFDHADIFKDLDHVNEAFKTFIKSISKNSTIFAFGGDDNLGKLLCHSNCPVVNYAMGENSLWQIGNVSINEGKTLFEVLKVGNPFGQFKTGLQGMHNLFNALADIALVDTIGLDKTLTAKGLKTFAGIKRRQEIRGKVRGITVLDDFAHHPTAVNETIKAIKPYYPSGRLIAVFEARTNSSMRKVFQEVYPLSFDHADIICIAKPPLLNKIPPKDRFSSEKLVNDLKDRGKDAHYFPDSEKIIQFIEIEAKSGDVILIMSNGGFDNIHENLLKRLSS